MTSTLSAQSTIATGETGPQIIRPSPATTFEGQTTAASCSISRISSSAQPLQSLQAPTFKKRHVPFKNGGVNFELHLSASIAWFRPFQKFLLTIKAAGGGQREALFFRSEFDFITHSTAGELSRLRVDERLKFQDKPSDKQLLISTAEFEAQPGLNSGSKETIESKMIRTLADLESLWKPELCPSLWGVDPEQVTEAVERSCEMAKEFWQALDAEQARGVAVEK